MFGYIKILNLAFVFILPWACKEATIDEMEDATPLDGETTEVTVTPLTIDPEFFGFGTVLSNSGAASKEFALANAGKKDVYFTTIELSQKEKNFALDARACPRGSDKLTPGISCKLKITFEPLTEGIDQATIDISFGDAPGSVNFTQSIGLNGFGGTAIGNSAISFNPTQVTFASVAAGTGSETKEIVLKNIESAGIFIASVGGSDTDMTIANTNCPINSEFNSKESCKVSATFHPKSGGLKTNALTVYYGFKKGSSDLTALLSLTGTGVSALDFDGISSVSGITTTQATLHWSEPSGVSTYYVYRIVAGSPTLVTTLAAGTTSYNLTSLSAGTTYTYRVNATDSLGILDSNTNNVSFTTSSAGTFANIADISVAEAATGQTALLSCTDSGGNTASYSIASESDSDGTCTISGGRVSCTPAYKTGHSSWTSAVAVQCSLNGSTYNKSFTLTVTDTNRAPALDAIADESVVAGSAITSVNTADGGNDTDADLDALSYTCTFAGGGSAAGTACSSLPNSAYSFSSSTGVLTWTPSYAAAVSSANTDYTITITGSDQQGSPLTASEALTITVTPAEPVLTGISDYAFPTTYLDIAATLSVDVNNIRAGSPGNDTAMTYACVFDQVVDGAVAAGTNCSSLTGTVSFSTSAGTLSWVPTSAVFGPYEFKITGTNAAGSDTEIFAVPVRQAYVTTNLRAAYDAQFATLSGPNSSGTANWNDLTANDYDGTAEGNADTTWAGTGAYSSPWRNQLDGSGRIDFGANPMASQTKMMFSSWINPASVATGNATIAGNSANATGNGFSLRQSKSQTGKMELVIGKSYQEAVLADNPVGYWRLSESSGTTATDISGFGNHGTYVGSPTLSVSGALTNDKNTAATFNGSSQRVTVSYNASMAFTNKMSIEFWFNNATVADTWFMGQWAGGQPSNWAISLERINPRLGIYFNGYTIQVYKYIAMANGWHHAAFVYDGTEATDATRFKIYLDGTLLSSTVGTIPTSFAANAADLSFGGAASHGGFFNGSVDEVAFYTTALTAADITEHWNAAAGSVGSTCVSTTTFSNSVWSLLSTLYDGTDAKLFVNGRQECTTTASTGFTSPASSLVAGSSSASAQINAFSGGVADMKLYATSDGTSAASSTNILTNFNATADRFRASPVSSSGVVSSGMNFFMDAANADGLRFPSSGCSYTSWLDLTSTGATGTLTSFSGCGGSSGWNGAGTSGDPYRLDFDGSNDYVLISNGFTNTLKGDDTYSISMWVKPANAANSSILLDSTTSGGTWGIQLQFAPTGFYWTSGPGSYRTYSGLTWNSANWYNITVVKTGAGDSGNLYVNGILKTTYSGSITNTATHDNDFYLGRYGANASHFFQGAVANIQFWNTALSASEVTENCNALESRFSGATCE